MIPLAVPNLTGNEARYLQECINSTFVSSVGPFVDKLENMVASATDAKLAVCTASGTAGLHLALKSIGVQQGELVILPAFTFIASANAIDYCGAIPWLMEISETSWCLDPDALRGNLEKHTELKNNCCIHKESGRRVAAIMPVHTLGHPSDMDAIMEVAGEFGLDVIADAAAAIGSEYKSRPMGPLGARLAVFSFNGNKTITSGGGGVICGDDEELLKRIKHLSTTARVTEKYDHDEVGYNYRITNVEAAVGCAQMERLSEFIEKKRNIRKKYNQAFDGIAGISLFPEEEWAISAAWFSGIVINDADPGAMDEIRHALRKENIEARPFWKPIHLQAPYRHAIFGKLDYTDYIWSRILTLPCSTGLTESDQEYVINSLMSMLKQ